MAKLSDVVRQALGGRLEDAVTGLQRPAGQDWQAVLRDKAGTDGAGVGTSGEKLGPGYINWAYGEYGPQAGRELVSRDQLAKFGWKPMSDGEFADLNENLARFGINTPARIRHFLAQCARETGKGRSFAEGGDEAYLKRLYWDDEDNRQWTGNLSPVDAVRFRGGGGIQMTGRNAYQAFSDYVAEKTGKVDPRIMAEGADYVAEKYPWVAAGRWWHNNGMNELVDRLAGDDHAAMLTRSPMW